MEGTLALGRPVTFDGAGGMFLTNGCPIVKRAYGWTSVSGLCFPRIPYVASFTLMLEPTPVLALPAQSHAHKLGWARWHVRRYGKHGLCLKKLLGIASSLPSVQ